MQDEERESLLIWFADKQDEMQKRLSQMIINDLNKFSFSGKYNKEYRDFLINKYKEY